MPLLLSSLSSFMFDPRQMPAGEVHLVTEDLSAAHMTLAAIVASGIARRFDYRKVSFSVSSELRPGVDNVLIGSKGFVEPFLTRRGVAAGTIEGGYLRLLHLPAVAGGEPDPRHALLVISGHNEEAVKIGAVTFANISFAYPGTPDLRAYQFSLPDIGMYTGRQVLNADRTYEFKTLNFPTQSFTGLNAGSRSIDFRLPSDFLIKQNQYAKLGLNLSYGAGLRSDSSLNVSVNGKGARAIPLDSAAGGFI